MYAPRRSTGRTPSQQAEQRKAEGNVKFKEKMYGVSRAECPSCHACRPDGVTKKLTLAMIVHLGNRPLAIYTVKLSSWILKSLHTTPIELLLPVRQVVQPGFIIADLSNLLSFLFM